MPELPEVEIVRKSLDKKIKQKKVKKVIVRNRNLRFRIPLNFKNFLKGQKITKVKRFSKYLIFCFSNNVYCLLHLGMSGTIHLIDKNKKNFITNTSFYNSPTLPKNHNHVEIFFENFKIVYNDPRRFGFFEIIKNQYLLKERFERFGPEPFSPKFNLKYVTSYLQDKKKKIKNFLLDQNFVSGIGNIYANEILFLSKIDPNKKARTLKNIECKKIIANSRKVLLNAIKQGGSSIRDFKDTYGNSGNFQKNFKVYERAGLSCKRHRCNGIIKKKIISMRSTFLCDICQI
tara:strand:- start:10 stop:873 length:864 start_codon:yes stop_codon:yes gene_type:complete